jgi:putative SOS response-associated peptidase YedK
VCGRYTAAKDYSELIKLVGIMMARVPFFGPRYNIAPTQFAPAIYHERHKPAERELLVADRTASPPGEGLKSYADTSAGKTTVYDKNDTRPVISPVAQAMLIKFGALISTKSGAVRLVRAKI